MIEMLKRLSPVPIKFVDEMQCWGYDGMFWYRNSSPGHPYIEILNGLEKHREIAVLIHEIAHAMCNEKNCKCLKVYEKNPVLTEIHAFKYTLRWLLKHQQKEALKYELKCIKSYITYRSDHYVNVAKHLMKLKLWQKCLDFINNP